MLLTADEIDVHVGRRLRMRREALGISQGRLASHLGLTFSQVQKYEKGANRIGAGRLFLAASFLKVPVQYFVAGLDQNSPSENGDDRSGKESHDLAVLDDAFLSILDQDKRRSLLALVCALASPDNVAGRPTPTAPGR